MAGEASMSEKSSGCFTGRVISARHPCREHFELTIAFDDFPDSHPGQFVQILCRDPATGDESTAPVDPMLRRPFSIGGLRRVGSTCEIEIVGRVVGNGTAWLNARQPKDAVNVIGPLGRPFNMPTGDRLPLLVAGGVGLPPIRWWAEVLASRGVSPRFIFGAQSSDLIPLTLNDRVAVDGSFSECVGELASWHISCAVTTDDGTCGLKGRVTDALVRLCDAPNAGTGFIVYACGPEPMLHAVARLCQQHSIPCELALERVMACGLATCQSCVVKVSDADAVDGWRYALCCTEGPVFDASRLIWESD